MTTAANTTSAAPALNILSIPEDLTTIPSTSFLGQLAQKVIDFCVSARQVLANLPQQTEPTGGVDPETRSWVSGGPEARIERACRKWAAPLGRLRDFEREFSPELAAALKAELEAHAALADALPRPKFPEVCPPELQVLAQATDEAFGGEFPRGAGVGLRRAITPWCPLPTQCRVDAPAPVGELRTPVLAGQDPREAAAILAVAFGDAGARLAVLNSIESAHPGAYRAELLRLQGLVALPGEEPGSFFYGL